MALQSSGQISINDIKTELGNSSGSLNTLSVAAGKAAPHAMSEFYGYSASIANDYYWEGDGVNDTLRQTGTALGYNTNTDLSWSGWYRIDETSSQVQQFGSISTSSPSGANQVFLQYHGSLKRIFIRWRHSNSFHQRQYPLHDNQSITGVNSNGWYSTNRGNTNGDGFVHLVFTYDASDRNASTGLNVYWNAQKLTSSVNNHSISSPSHWDAGSHAVGDLVSSSPYNANVFKGGIDEVCIYTKVLTQSEITSLYNSGTPTSAENVGVTSSLVAEYRFENNDDNSVSGGWTSVTNSGGTYVNPSE